MSQTATVEMSTENRLDRRSWHHFHRLVTALGVTWPLDRLEVMLIGPFTGAIHESSRLRLIKPQVGLTASAYLIGAVSGALFFGWLTD